MPRADAACALDTHAWLFAASDGGERLGRRARRLLSSVTTAWIPAISLWEVAMLAERGRINLDRPLDEWLSLATTTPPFALQPLTSGIAAMSAELGAMGFHSEPADRLIYATAVVLDVPLLTADRRIGRFEKGRPARRIVWN